MRTAILQPVIHFDAFIGRETQDTNDCNNDETGSVIEY